ncbi:MAG: hypothetical protein ACTTHG_04995 [Treponemataceae bacterium]
MEQDFQLNEYVKFSDLVHSDEDGYAIFDEEAYKKLPNTSVRLGWWPEENKSKPDKSISNFDSYASLVSENKLVYNPTSYKNFELHNTTDKFQINLPPVPKKLYLFFMENAEKEISANEISIAIWNQPLDPKIQNSIYQNIHKIRDYIKNHNINAELVICKKGYYKYTKLI